MSTQPEALRLADELETWRGYVSAQAATELRRLHALCEEMGEALSATLSLIRRNAPELSGKTIGIADVALAKWKESNNKENHNV